MTEQAERRTRRPVGPVGIALMTLAALTSGLAVAPGAHAATRRVQVAARTRPRVTVAPVTTVRPSPTVPVTPVTPPPAPPSTAPVTVPVTPVAPTTPVTAPPTTAAPASPPANADAAAMLGWVNAARAGRGLPPLAWDDRLAAIGAAWSQDMSVNGFRHQSMSVLMAAIGGRGSVAENIAWGNGATLQSLHQTLLDSPGHYANIMSTSSTHIGIGVYRQGSQIWVTQEFSS